jgi:hypothetical protein
MLRLIAIILMSTGNIGYGLLILIVAFVFIFGLDRIIRLVIYLVDKVEERRRDKQK